MDEHQLVLNVYNNDVIVGQVAKCFSLSAPKYLSSGSRTHQIIDTNNSDAGSELLLVEDLRSAYKCARLINVLPLLGTHLSAENKAAVLAFKPSKVLIWLDNDNPQVRKSAREIKKGLQPFVPCVIIDYRDSDPKALGESKLKEILNGDNER